MPSINGITCGIYTHEGKLDECALDEISGGLSCYIPAKSGQQFWLSYSIDKPITAKALSIDFWVDGNRIDTQFPLASAGSDPPTVGPIASTINSQYGKDERGVAYRREVFFTLDEQAKQWSYWPQKGSEGESTKMGTIECKVYRAEKTGVWEGTISPEEMPDLDPKKSIRRKGVSHRARLGASIPAAKTTRYTFRNLDANDAPFAYFKFYYRSYKFLKTNHLTESDDGIRPAKSELGPQSPASKLPRSMSKKIGRRASVNAGLKKPRSRSVPALSLDLSTPFTFSTDPISPTHSSAPASEMKTSQSVLDLHSAIAKLEAEFLSARNSDDSEVLQNCYEKLGRLKRTAEKLRVQAERESKGQGRVHRVTIKENPKEDASSSPQTTDKAHRAQSTGEKGR